MDRNIKVSVIVPAYNEEKYIGDCLKSIANQTQKADEVIVVDNNCTDKTVEIAKKLGARIVKEKKQGMIFARNAGCDAAQYELIARTDADGILPSNWISKIKEYFKDPNLGALSGPVSYTNLPIISDFSRLGTFLTFKGIGLLFSQEMLSGPNMVIGRSLWEKVKNKVCLENQKVHEDIDLSLHLGKFAKIRYDWSFNIRTTRGRWVKIFTEYVVRLMKMFISHRLRPAG